MLSRAAVSRVAKSPEDEEDEEEDLDTFQHTEMSSIDVLDMYEKGTVRTDRDDHGRNSGSSSKRRKNDEDNTEKRIRMLLYDDNNLSEILEIFCSTVRIMDFKKSLRYRFYRRLANLPVPEVMSLFKPFVSPALDTIRPASNIFRDAYIVWGYERMRRMIEYGCQYEEYERMIVHMFGKLIHEYRDAKLGLDQLLSCIPERAQSKALLRKIYNKVMSVCVHDRRYEDLEQVWLRMRQQQVPLDAASFNIQILRLLSQEGHMDQAVQVYETMVNKHDIQPNVVTFNTFISHACRNRMWDDLELWLDRLALHSEFDKTTLGIVLKAAAIYKTEPRVLSALHRVADVVPVDEEEELLLPTVVALLRHKRVDEALPLLERLFVNSSKELSVKAYNVLIHGLCLQRRLEDAHQVLYFMIAGDDKTIPSPDVVSFTTLIHGYARYSVAEDTKMSTILRLYREMRRLGIPTSPVLQEVLFYSFIKTRYDDIGRIRTLFNMLIEEDDERRRRQRKDASSDTGPHCFRQMLLYNMMMDGYFIHIFYRKKLDSFATVPMKEPYRLLNEALRKGLQPTSATLNIWVRGLSVFCKDIAAAERMFRRFRSLGVEPNELTIYYMVREGRRYGRPNKARQWLQEYEKERGPVRGNGICRIKSELGL